MARKTMREWFNELPEGYREEAIKEMERQGINGDELCDSLADAVYSLGWHDSANGRDWWGVVWGYLEDPELEPTLPPLPTPSERSVTTDPTEIDGNVFDLIVASDGEVGLFKREAEQFTYEGILITQSRDELIALRDLLNKYIK